MVVLPAVPSCPCCSGEPAPGWGSGMRCSQGCCQGCGIYLTANVTREAERGRSRRLRESLPPGVGGWMDAFLAVLGCCTAAKLSAVRGTCPPGSGVGCTPPRRCSQYCLRTAMPGGRGLDARAGQGCPAGGVVDGSTAQSVRPGVWTRPSGVGGTGCCPGSGVTV